MRIDCPGDCPYLIAAHRYQTQRPVERRGVGRARPARRELAFATVEIDADFLQEKQELIAGLSLLIVRCAGEHSEVRDPDLLAALDALAQSYQTLESGLYYEKPPESAAARVVYAAAQSYLSHYAEEQQKRTGMSVRPGEVLRAVVFLRRLGQLEANGRPLSRRYLGFLRAQLPAEATAGREPRLIVPGR